MMKANLDDLQKCRKCGSEMKPSKAIECKLTGKPDFAGDKYACTVSPDPKQPMLVDCLKCASCGWSVSWTPMTNDEKFALVD